MDSTPSIERLAPSHVGSDEMVLLVRPGLSVSESPRILYANGPFCSTFGYSPDELVGQTTHILRGEGTRPSDVARFARIFADGESASGGTLLYTKARLAVYTEWQGNLIEDPEFGKVIQAYGRIVDRRRPADGDLRSLIAAIEHANDAIIIYELFQHDDAPRVQYANRAAEILSGYSRKELHSATRLGAETDRGSVKALIATMQRGESIHSRQLLYRKDGSTYWAEINARPLLESMPGMWRWISIERDITDAVENKGLLTEERDTYSTLAAAAKVFLDSHDRDRLETTHANAREHLIAAGRREAADLLASMYESALRRLTLFTESIDRRNETLDVQAAQSDVMAMLAHDIRGPLNTVIGFAELIGEVSAAPECAEYAALIVRAGNRVLELTNEVVVAAQLDRNEYKPAQERFDLLSLIESVVSLLPGSGRAKFNFANEHIDVESDMAGVRHIVSNLASNAFKYSDPDSPIDIMVRCAGERVRIVFRDSGMGIPADELETIFDRFARASNAKASNVRGTGLGLYFVKQLVERCHGSIEISSTVGAGTTVTVALPLHTLSSFDVPLILSVESSGEDRSLIASELRKHGYVVRVVPTVAAAEGVMRHDRTGLVIADIDVLGADAMALLGSDCLSRSIPAIITGSSCDADDARQLRKPFVAADLVRKVESIVPLLALELG